jgi:hypothetical protein
MQGNSLSLSKKFLLIILFFLTVVGQTFAAGLLGFEETSGCSREADKYLPTLVICGRSKAVGACEAYTNPCTLGDLVETGRRVLIWIITIVLMILPVIIAYYGALMIINRDLGKSGISLADIKNRILWLIIYFVCLLGAWIIVRTIVDLSQVQTSRINTFLIDENGNAIQSRQFDFNR